MIAKGYIAGLDGIRGLSVVFVVLTHLGTYTYLQNLGVLHPAVVPIVHGGTGVFAFFILSGFLITTLLAREHQDAGGVSLKRFYMRRGLRILPLYFLIIALALLLSVAGLAKVHWASFPFAWSFMYNFVPRGVYSGILGHTWTLAVEEHFYLVWPIAFVWATARGAKLVANLALGAFVLSLIAKILLVQTPLNAEFFIHRWTFVAGGYIALGAGLALLLHQSAKSHAWRSTLGSPFTLGIALVLFAHSLVINLEGLMLDTHVRCVGIGLFIAWVYLNPGSHIVKALEVRPLRYIGRISYGVYMWQGLLLSTGPARVEGVFWPPDPAIGLVILLFIAPLSYHFFEQPFLQLKGRFSGPASSDASLVEVQRPK